VGCLEISGLATNSKVPSVFGHLSFSENFIFILPFDLKKNFMVETAAESSAERSEWVLIWFAITFLE